VKEDFMMRKGFFLTIFAMVVLTSLLVGCGTTSAELTPTPDPSIVWSDDFEDGDMEGWEEIDPVGFISVKEGVLTVGPEMGGAIERRSDVSTGTWSFDVFMTEDLGSGYQFVLCICNGHQFGFGIQISSLPNTVINTLTVEKGEKSPVDEYQTGSILTGWNHFDITRDEQGYSKIFLNGEQILEYKDELTINSSWFRFEGHPIGPALDNVVVRNQVIDIQP
jgi:hypothetical protein